MFSNDELVNPVSGTGGLTTPRAAAAIVIGALILLILIRKGFHPSVSVSVK